VWYSGDPDSISSRDFGHKPFDPFPQLPSEQNPSARWIFPLANPFAHDGNDIIDAGATFAGYAVEDLPTVGLTIYGGPGDDRIVGSQAGDHLAGGSGDDTILGEGGQDQIYGDSHFNVDVITRVLTVVTEGPAGRNRLFGGDGNDIIFGDHGIITQTPGTERLFTTAEVIRAETTNIFVGASDVIVGGDGDDALFGGYGSDYIGLDRDGTQLGPESGDDFILGDHGFMLFDPRGGINRVIHMETTDPLVGHSDWIDAGDDHDVVFGGTGGDAIWGGAGSDILLGDHGLWSLSRPRNQRFLSIFTGDDDGGGDDVIFGGAGDDFILGQQGNDWIFGGLGEDDLTGGHNVEFGADGDDHIYGGDRPPGWLGPVLKSCMSRRATVRM
jgi:Ca2+-binding RTX toxin-like protein